MKITFAPNNILQIDDAKIIFRNFSGIAGKYNREGDRNFAVVIPDEETAQALMEAGWNITVKPPREEGEEPLRILRVKVKFNGRGPNIYLRSNDVTNKLDEEGVGVLDRADIQSVDMDLRPYNWNEKGESGRTAYLQAIRVTQKIDRFAERVTDGNIPTPEELAERMRDAAKDDDQECRHYNMDGILLDVLDQLGYGEAVKIFRETPAWYA